MPKATKKKPQPEAGDGDLTKEEFGRRLKQARMEAGYESQSEAARKLGMRAVSYWELESGHTMPSFSRLVAVVRVLGLDPATIAPEWFGADREDAR